MQRNVRNQLFVEKSALIDQTLKRHSRLLQACRLSWEDARQELAVRMLECLDRYDANLCPNLDAYLVKQMNYTLFHQLAPSKRYGIPNAPKVQDFRVISLEDRCTNSPTADKPEALLWIKEEIAALPDSQRTVIQRLLNGDKIRSSNKELRSARLRLRKKGMASFGQLYFKKKGA